MSIAGPCGADEHCNKRQVTPVNTVGTALTMVFTGFVDRLRVAGVDVSTSAVIDAGHALQQVDLGSLTQVRTALLTTLIKHPDDLPAFSIAFERYFAPRSGALRSQQPEATGSAATQPAAGDDHARIAPSASETREQLIHALAASDRDGVVSLARLAAQRFGGVRLQTGSERYHLQRVLRALGMSGLLQDALRVARNGGPRSDELTERLTRSELEALLAELGDAILDELRRLMAEAHPGTEGTAMVDPRRAEDIDFLGASTSELWEMRRAVRPLARKLATRLAMRQRRRPRGRVDMRRTIRVSLSSGGVPIHPVLRQRHPHRPEVWLLCDISGSVAEFARFTLAFLYAMHEEMARLRSFVFVDTVDEVTALLQQRAHDVDPFVLLNRACAAQGRRRSDYGRALSDFWASHGDDLTPSCTLIITGDARSHHGDPRTDVLAGIAERVKRLWLLNPEPRERWDRDDSVVSLYAPTCDRVAEVRNLRQLSEVVAELG
jgi:uncharacterized protein